MRSTRHDRATTYDRAIARATCLPALLLVLLAGAAPAAAKSCFESLPYQYAGQAEPISFCATTPECHLTPPPMELWGELEPLQVLHNTTHAQAQVLSTGPHRAWSDLAIVGNRMVVAHWSGLGVYDVSDPTAIPPPLAVLDGWDGAFPVWLPALTEIDTIFRAVAIPDGDPSFAVIAGITPGGVVVVDLTEASAPLVRYQDNTVDSGSAIYAARIGDRTYAFVPTVGGLRVYDLTATREQGCVGAFQSSPGNACAGAVHTTVGDPMAYVGGLRLPNGRTLVVSSSGNYLPHRFDVWDGEPLVTGATSSPLATRTDTPTHGVAIWQHRDPAGAVFVATREQSKVQIHELTATCLATGACAGEPITLPAASVALPVVHGLFTRLSLSWSGDVPFVYAGNAGGVCDVETPGTEALIRLAAPANPAVLELADISPRQQESFESWTLPDPDGLPPAPMATRTVDYWSWYAMNPSWGWGGVLPLAGKFKGPYFLRAAHALGDVHRWTSPFAGPDPVFADGFEVGDGTAWSTAVP